MGVEAMNDIADGLIVAAEAVSNQAGMLAPCAAEQDLAAAKHEGIGRTQASIDCLLFSSGEGPHKDGSSHAEEDTTFPTTLLETALETGSSAPGYALDELLIDRHA